MIQQEMLKYQSLDGELARIERELKKNKFYLQRKQLKAMRQECEDTLVRLDAKAADLRNQLASLRQGLHDINGMIDEYSNEIVDIEDKDELNYINKKLAEQTDLLTAAERDIKRVLREGEELAAAFDEINAKLPKIVAGYARCNDEFAKATEEVKPKVLQLKTEQTELKKAIEPKLFEAYKHIADAQIRPVFVPLRDGCRCGGCQMEMPKAVVDAQLQSKDYLTCEHCGRIVYKQ